MSLNSGALAIALRLLGDFTGVMADFNQLQPIHVSIFARLTCLTRARADIVMRGIVAAIRFVLPMNSRNAVAFGLANGRHTPC